MPNPISNPKWRSTWTKYSWVGFGFIVVARNLPTLVVFHNFLDRASPKILSLTMRVI